MKQMSVLMCGVNMNKTATHTHQNKITKLQNPFFLMVTI
jgi:hypothetical protein